MFSTSKTCKNIIYYILGILSISIIFMLGFKFFFASHFKESKYYFYKAYFSNVEGLTTKTPVMLFGYKIGAIKKIYLDQEFNPIVVLAIEKKFPIPDDSSISIKEDGLIGDKVVQLNLGINEDTLDNKAIIVYTNNGISLLSLVDLLINYISNLKDNIKNELL